MFRRVLIVSLLMLVIISGAFAGNLLRRSILSCSHDELVAMCLAYGLDSTLSDQEMKDNLLDYFGAVEEDEPVIGTAASAPAEETATSIGISHADRLYSNDDVIILSGNVGLTFTTKDGTRSLTADTVAVDLNSKILEATGSVELGGYRQRPRVYRRSSEPGLEQPRRHRLRGNQLHHKVQLFRQEYRLLCLGRGRILCRDYVRYLLPQRNDSHNGARSVLEHILVETFEPPMMATNGRLMLLRTLSTAVTSFSISRPSILSSGLK